MKISLRLALSLVLISGALLLADSEYKNCPMVSLLSWRKEPAISPRLIKIQVCDDDIIHVQATPESNFSERSQSDSGAGFMPIGCLNRLIGHYRKRGIQSFWQLPNCW